MSELSRRDFLKLLGVTTAGTALVGANTMWEVPDELVAEALRGPGIESFKKSVCQLCPSGCGIDVRLVDGIPVHIDGSAVEAFLTLPLNRRPGTRHPLIMVLKGGPHGQSGPHLNHKAQILFHLEN